MPTNVVPTLTQLMSPATQRGRDVARQTAGGGQPQPNAPSQSSGPQGMLTGEQLEQMRQVVGRTPQAMAMRAGMRLGGQKVPGAVESFNEFVRALGLF